MVNILDDTALAALSVAPWDSFPQAGPFPGAPSLRFMRAAPYEDISFDGRIQNREANAYRLLVPRPSMSSDYAKRQAWNSKHCAAGCP